MRRILAPILGLTAVAMVMAPTPAHADLDGTCNKDDVCLYWLTNYGKPIRDEWGINDNYAGDYFINSNKPLNDNTESATNFDAGNRAVIYQHAYRGEPSVKLRRYGYCPGGQDNVYADCYAKRDLGWAKNQLSSHYWEFE